MCAVKPVESRSDGSYGGGGGMFGLLMDGLRKKDPKAFDAKVSHISPAARRSVGIGTPSEESTPPKLRTSGNSGLSIRSSGGSKQSAPKATSGGARSSGRKRFNTS